MTRWIKIYRDLWINRSRTVLIILSIAVGVFAIGLIGMSQIALLESLNEQYAAMQPADPILQTEPMLDEDFVEGIRNIRGVEEAEGRRYLLLRISLDGKGETWRDLTLGEPALPMTPIAFIADTSHWIVKTKDLAEVDVARVSVEDSVRVKLDAFPDEEFTGVVSEVNPIGKLYLGDMTYQVTITLDEPDSRFLWNMTAVITVNIEREQS